MTTQRREGVRFAVRGKLAAISADSRRDLLWLMLVLSVGSALRLWGIDFGLPGLYHPDEGLAVRQALAFGAGILRPYSYVYSPFLPYILTVLYGLYFVLGLLTGRFHSPSDLAVLYFNEPTPFYLLARLVSAAFGVTIIVVAYTLAVRAYGRVAGSSALAVALSPLLVLHGHYGMSDVPAACLALIALYAVWRFTARPTRRRFVLAGVTVGLAIVMKYSVWVLVVPLLVSLLLVAGRERWAAGLILRYLLLGGLLVAGAFVAVSPFTLLDFRNFWADVVVFQLGTQLGQGQTFTGLLAYYSRAVVTEGLGLPLSLMALAGLSLALYRRRPADMLLASFTVAYSVMLLLQGRQQLNWVIPLLPVLSILAALTLDELWRAVMPNLAMHWRSQAALAGLALLLIVVWPMAGRAYGVGRVLSCPDTRSRAREWIEAHIPAGAKILSDPMWTVPQLRQSRESLVRYLDERAKTKDIESRPGSTQVAYSQYTRYQLAALERYAGPTYDLVYIQHEWWKTDESAPDIQVYPVWGLFRGQVFSLEELREQGFQYAVVSSLKYSQYLREEGKEKWPSYYMLYSSLEEQCPSVKEFAPDTGTNGPIIKIYDMRAHP